LGFFSFFPSSISIFASAMEDGLLTFLTLILFFLLLREKKNYAAIFAVSGLLVLTKYAGTFIVLPVALATIFFLKDNKKTKILLLVMIISGALLIGAPWYYRNGVALGNPFYHPAGREYTMQPGALTFNSIINVYMDIWAIPPVSSIFNKFMALNEGVIDLLRACAGLLFLPVFYVFMVTLRKFWKELKVFVPVIAAFLFFAYVYMKLQYDWTDSRHFLPALPFLSLVLGYGARMYRTKNFQRYFLMVFIMFIGLQLITTYVIAENRASVLESIDSLQAEYGNYTIKTYPRSDEMPNQTFLKAFLFVYRNITTENSTYYCDKYERADVISYCLTDNTINVYW